MNIDKDFLLLHEVKFQLFNSPMRSVGNYVYNDEHLKPYIMRKIINGEIAEDFPGYSLEECYEYFNLPIVKVLPDDYFTKKQKSHLL